MKNEKMELKGLENVSKHYNIYLKEENRKKKGKKIV